MQNMILQIKELKEDKYYSGKKIDRYKQIVEALEGLIVAREYLPNGFIDNIVGFDKWYVTKRGKVGLSYRQGREEPQGDIEMITFNELLKCYNDDLEKQGIYNKQKALKSLLNDILEGYKDIQEAKDNLVIMQKNQSIYYTARGYEVNYQVLKEAIKKYYKNE